MEDLHLLWKQLTDSVDRLHQAGPLMHKRVECEFSVIISHSTRSNAAEGKRVD